MAFSNTKIELNNENHFHILLIHKKVSLCLKVCCCLDGGEDRGGNNMGLHLGVFISSLMTYWIDMVVVVVVLECVDGCLHGDFWVTRIGVMPEEVLLPMFFFTFFLGPCLTKHNSHFCLCQQSFCRSSMRRETMNEG